MNKFLTVISTAIVLALPAAAHEDDIRHAGAHVHGKGEAFISLSGTRLTFDLTAPKANFALADGGFANASGENMPALADLISVTPAAKCEQESLKIEVLTIGGTEHEGHDDHDEDHQEHADDHDEHMDHDDEDGHHDEDDHTGHQDFLLSGKMTCAAPDKLKSVELTLFETFTGFESLNVVFTTDDDMLATTLGPNKTKVNRP